MFQAVYPDNIFSKNSDNSFLFFISLPKNTSFLEREEVRISFKVLEYDVHVFFLLLWCNGLLVQSSNCPIPAGNRADIPFSGGGGGGGLVDSFLCVLTRSNYVL